jgi:hypothetical protein
VHSATAASPREKGDVGSLIVGYFLQFVIEMVGETSLDEVGLSVEGFTPQPPNTEFDGRNTIILEN